MLVRFVGGSREHRSDFGSDCAKCIRNDDMSRKWAAKINETDLFEQYSRNYIDALSHCDFRFFDAHDATVILRWRECILEHVVLDVTSVTTHVRSTYSVTCSHVLRRNVSRSSVVFPVCVWFMKNIFIKTIHKQIGRRRTSEVKTAAWD